MKFVIFAAAVLAAAPACADELYTVTHGKTAVCQISPDSFGVVFKSFSIIMAQYGFPPPTIDNETYADVGVTAMKYTDIDTGKPKVGVYFTDHARCEIFAAALRRQ
jgi:hypothetical protein